MPKVSIIIPIYNVKRYLEQCLNSVINQTLKVLEDSGSSDNCPSICDAYASKDIKNRNIKQKNKIEKPSVLKFNLFGIKISHRRKFIKPQNPYIPKAVKKRTPNEISIVISTDNNYAHYAGVTIQSIIKNSSKNKKYTIYILDGGISLSNKLKLKFMQTHNVKIRYININSYLRTCNQKLLYTHNHFTIATYFRFFIPIIFRDFTKVIYCDCDGIFMDDIAKLYDINMGTNLLGAVSDTYYNIILNRPEIRDYSYNILKLKDPTNYFQAGLLIMNIPELKRMDFTESCFKALKAIKTPRYVDQCILNSVCQGKVLYLDASWNLENPVIKDIMELKSKLPQDFCDNYMKAFENPRFIHFCGPIKPWNTPNVPHSEYFWEYARMTPFYKQINKINQASITDEKTFYKNSLQKVFSVKNISSGNNCHKVLTIMGVRMKFKRNKVKIR